MNDNILKPVHPGEVLREEFLKPMGISQNHLALRISIPARRINEIVLGKRRITADTALRLARYFGNSAKFWLGLQTDFDLDVATDRLRPKSGQDVSRRWVEANLGVPRSKLAEFCRKRHIQKLAFFGSVLRDDFGPYSDVDVLVEFDPGHVPGLEFFGLQRELAEILGRRVDLHTPADLSPRFRCEVLDELVNSFEPAPTDKTKPMPKQPLSKVTPKNLHSEVDTGEPMGSEI